MARSMASLSRRRSLCRSAASSLTSMSSWNTRSDPSRRRGRARPPHRAGRSGPRTAGPVSPPPERGRRGRSEATSRPPATGTTPSSPRPSRSASASSLAASAASGPWAMTWTLCPWATSMPMMAITLLALAWSSPRLSRMSLSYFCARLDRTAAGRACRPAGFGRMIASRGHAAARRRGCVLGRAVRRVAASVASATSSAPGGHQAGARRERRDAVGVGDHHLGEQALGAGRHLVQVEGDQLVAGPDLVAHLDLGGRSPRRASSRCPGRCAAAPRGRPGSGW